MQARNLTPPGARLPFFSSFRRLADTYAYTYTCLLCRRDETALRVRCVSQALEKSVFSAASSFRVRVARPRTRRSIASSSRKASSQNAFRRSPLLKRHMPSMTMAGDSESIRRLAHLCAYRVRRYKHDLLPNAHFQAFPRQTMMHRAVRRCGLGRIARTMGMGTCPFAGHMPIWAQNDGAAAGVLPYSPQCALICIRVCALSD